MRQKFERPVYETISFGRDVITASRCGCDIGGIDMGDGKCDENICVSINTWCDCWTNTTDETKANCIKP